MVLESLHKRLGYKKLTQKQRILHSYETNKRKYETATERADEHFKQL